MAATQTQNQRSAPTQNADAPALRLWPGVVLALTLAVVRFGLPLVAPGIAMFAYLGAVALSLAVLVWWLFFSRARWMERLTTLLVIVVAIAATAPLLHDSLATAGMGILFFIYALVTVALALVLALVLTRNAPASARRWTTIAAVLIASFGWLLVRTEGTYGASGSQLAWRWSPTPEERLLANAERPSGGATAVATVEAAWPGFRGPRRDGVIPAISINTDWDAHPPVELWRRPVGPGWSSFAVAGDYLFTQEQRGEEEAVSCYSAVDGALVWQHVDGVRFWESNAGAGPRGTPTLEDGRVYALGATGVLNVLMAEDGARVWSRDVAADTGARTPGWGFSGSPIVVGDVVLVAVAGQLAAYDKASGDLLWSGEKSGGYSSPHPVVLDGVPQVLMLGRDGVSAFSTQDGQRLWQHAMPGEPIVQPALTDNGDVLITTAGANGSVGILRVAVQQQQDRWSTEELWSSHRLKPYFNDFVVHDNHAYGFDGSIMAAIELDQGQRVWKGGRYGHGQLVLLSQQDLLLVVTELGDLALVRATPDSFTELARVPAIEGKTWNHPVLVRDRLFVRNAEEMAAFKLQLL